MMNVAEFFWQLTGSRGLRNAAHRAETTARDMIATLVAWQERGRQRRALAKLDAARLHDVGRSRYEVEQECAKPVWRA
jgi:uncharacterized protein YjiS (DUF1127 family)